MAGLGIAEGEQKLRLREVIKASEGFVSHCKDLGFYSEMKATGMSPAGNCNDLTFIVKEI